MYCIIAYCILIFGLAHAGIFPPQVCMYVHLHITAMIRRIVDQKIASKPTSLNLPYEYDYSVLGTYLMYSTVSNAQKHKQ
jgi:hypothetical protein